jgi:hypothetical protein
MQFQFQPDPLPERMRPAHHLDELCCELIDLASAWVGVRLRGVTDVHEARRLVQYETERLRCIAKMMEDGL